MPSEAADTHAGLPAGLDPFGTLATLSCSPFSPTAIRRKTGNRGASNDNEHLHPVKIITSDA